MRQFVLLVVLSFLYVLPVSAASTVECHCFQDRQYDPQKSGAADSYFLATTQNSLMATLFGVEKKSLVRAKMSGHDGRDLWILHYLSDKSGQPLLEIDRIRSTEESWRGVVSKLEIDEGQLDSGSLDLLGKPIELSSFIVGMYLGAKQLATDSAIDKLRRQGVSNKELILSVFIANSNKLDPQIIYKRNKNGESWGKLLHDSGLYDGDGIEQQWMVLLNR